MINGVSRHV